MNAKLLIALFLFGVGIVGFLVFRAMSGGGSDELPGWLVQPPVVIEGTELSLAALGQADPNPNPAVRQSMATARARTALARQLATVHVALAAELDPASPQPPAADLELWLRGARQVEGWRDPDKGILSVLLAVPVGAVLDGYQADLSARGALDDAASEQITRWRAATADDWRGLLGEPAGG